VTDNPIEERVKKAAATRVSADKTAGCDPISRNLYDPSGRNSLPAEAVADPLGCANPTALGKLQPGEIVFHLGCGGRTDVLLSAKRVAPGGKAYGLEMTDEGLSLARENQRKAGVENVEFLKGTPEYIPLPDNFVDVIISNGMMNRSGDKDRVMREAFRVLKRGGRFAVSEVVIRGKVPAELRKSMELWVGGIAGALEETEYREKLHSAGFDAIDVEATRVYQVEEAREFLTAAGRNAHVLGPQIKVTFLSAYIRARKPYACDCPPGCVDLPCCP
jgi:arsenite methyltransferase